MIRRFSIGLFLFIVSFACTAQSALQEDNVARPTPKYSSEDMPANPALPTLWIVGDSTARNGKDLGWGDHFAQFFDSSKINVVNRARAGRSSRTFIHEGAWDAVLHDMRRGDWVLIQMGHNDGGALDGPKPRGTLKGTGEESKDIVLQNGEHEVVHTFGWYLRKYIADARSKGATPLLMTLTVRNIWKDGHIERDMGYTAWINGVAASEKVPVLDLANAEADRLEKGGGAVKSAALFPVDHTHTSAAGAEMVALTVAQLIHDSDLPLKLSMSTFQ